jgi:hypothetical protein
MEVYEEAIAGGASPPDALRKVVDFLVTETVSGTYVQVPLPKDVWNIWVDLYVDQSGVRKVGAEHVGFPVDAAPKFRVR